MAEDGWKENLRSCFAGIRLIEQCQHETLVNFGQFCEFIAEPAFEALTEGLKEFGLRTKLSKVKNKSVAFEIAFPKTSIAQFVYIIALPKNSVDMKLRLKIRGRKTESCEFEDTDLSFMERVTPGEVLKLKKEDLLSDVIERYRDFMYRSLTTP